MNIEIGGEQQAMLSFKEDNDLIFLILDINWLYQEVRPQSGVTSYIIKSSGKPFFKPDKKIKENIIDFLKPSVDRGIFTADEDDGIEPGIYGFSRQEKFGLVFISFINNDDAFAIIYKIIMTSLSISLLGLGFFILLGLVFSRSLTKPIDELVQASKALTDKDFSYRVEIKTKDEFKILGDAFNSMANTLSQLFSEREQLINDLQNLNNQLEVSNKNLERRVSQRTGELSEAKRFIQAMVDSIDQGLFVFDRNGKCENFYTNSCKKIFGRTPYKLQFEEFVKLSEEETETFTKVRPLFFHETLPFDSAKGLALKRKTYSTTSDESEKHIFFDYYPMYDDTECLSHIVTVATDKTDEVHAQELYKSQQAFVAMILKIIENKKQFNAFLVNVSEIFDKIYDEVQGNCSLSTLSFYLHTLNGGLGIYKIYNIQNYVIKFESLISELKKKNGQSLQLPPDLIDCILTTFYETYSNFLIFLRENEYIWKESSSTLSIERDELEKLSSFLADNDSVMALSLCNDFLEKERVDILLSESLGVVSEMSEKLNKPMKEVKIIGADTRIDSSLNKSILSSLVHVFRNCMDHGIEPSDVRRKIGKDEMGEIIIHSSIDSAGNWHLNIRDLLDPC